MKGICFRILLVMVGIVFFSSGASANTCVECHKKITPGIASDWGLSKHSRNDVDCTSCHGDQHTSAEDVAKALLATPETCASCHEEQVEQYKGGKHSLAWVAMNAMPTAHWQPMALMEGMKGCGGCHKIGLKSDEETKKLRESESGFGVASCDSCHTRHLFSVQEARQPQTCRVCHMGIDHPQWEMFSSSRHGIRSLLKQIGKLPDSAAAPTCQTCHMNKGDHEVRTAWGFLAVRLPLPEDKEWAADRVTILQALGVLAPDGKPTARLEVVKAGDVARLTQEAWQKERDKMIGICNQCHSVNFVKGELTKGDRMIKQADHLMAKAIRLVAGLYQDGLLRKPQSYAYAFPDLLTFADAPTSIELKLFMMFLKYRMRTFQGVFHSNPDYAFWYGWSEMQRALTEITAIEKVYREKAKAKGK